MLRSFQAFNVCKSFIYLKLIAVSVPQFVIYHHIVSFARNYERKIDKIAETLLFSVYAVLISEYQKQT